MQLKARSDLQGANENAFVMAGGGSGDFSKNSKKRLLTHNILLIPQLSEVCRA